MLKNVIKLLLLLIIIFIPSYAKADDFKQINVKYFNEFFYSNDLGNTYNQSFEIESMAVKGKWDLYGFTDIIKTRNDKGFNIDFYKYLLKYDILGNNLLYAVTEVKRTYQDGDTFAGLGTTISIPIVGKTHINAMYLVGNKNVTSYGKPFLRENPYLLQFDWFNVLATFSNGISITQDGWSDIDFFTKDVNDHTTATQWQFYEGIAVNKGDLALEFGYKFWNNTYGFKNVTSNSGYIYLIKRF